MRINTSPIKVIPILVKTTKPPYKPQPFDPMKELKGSPRSLLVDGGPPKSLLVDEPGGKGKNLNLYA